MIDEFGPATVEVVSSVEFEAGDETARPVPTSQPCPTCGAPRVVEVPRYESPEPLVVDVTPFPDLAQTATRILRWLFEATDGHRPWSQVLHLATPPVIRSLRVAARIYRDPADATRVRTVHVSQPHEGAAELAAIAWIGRRYRAVAARLDLGPGDVWRCTALRIL
ncbi:Rv3235 family protein [Pseudonocardia dioxanivorans]|uniref:Rv3235 family protein n=1 Tax=Pseudonocardia dioxanivorans TaxID=240495 RepID=UPI000CD0486D|nr:Rv3235 family protein [Pseudonocardia dioxanivorans]